MMALNRTPDSESWLTRNMRPIAFFGIISTFGLTILLAVADALFGTHMAANVTQTMKQFPRDWLVTAITLCGGYVAARTAEKITSTIKK
jgi:hypothetical protein